MADFFAQLRRARSAPAATVADRRAAGGNSRPNTLLDELSAFAWIGGFLPLVLVLGFYSAVLLYVFCYLRLYAKKSAPSSITAAVVVTCFLYIVFGALMGYDIFGGVLGGDSL
jgi:hypothetical protein